MFTLAKIYSILHMKIHHFLAFALSLAVQTAAAQKAAAPTPAAPATAAPQQPIAVPKTIPEIKAALESSPNPLLYTKQILKRRFKIDTVIVSRTKSFHGLADSLAYNGKEKKVYGPYGPRGGQFLVQLLSKAPNEFYHIGQIFIDTSIFRYRIADSLSNLILKKVKDGSATFEDMARTYSMGGEAATRGDLGWIARGILLPQIEHEVIQRKKGEVFRIWSANGVHIIRKTDDPRQDTGFALMMQVFL
jgi:hypothetical protein